MKRFLDKITPGFIKQWERNMLLNSPLAWQFQLPRILWFWCCITLIGSLIPLLMVMDIASYNNDEGLVISFVVVFGILQFFLFGYILIQFNATKNFVQRRWWHGPLEQLVYVFVMMLCVSQLVVYSMVLDVRKAAYMSEEEINKEILVFNKARHYFMGNRDQYRYFPDDRTFLLFMSKQRSGSNEDAENYYYNFVTPELKEYFSGDPVEMKNIDKKFTRSQNAPKLYYVGEDYMKNKFEVYSYDIFSNSGYFTYSADYTPYTFQLHQKSRSERLSDIRAFLDLIKKYNALSYSNRSLTFHNSEEILDKYYSNQFSLTYYDSYEDEYIDAISTVGMENTYEHVMRAKQLNWKDAREKFLIVFFIAFPVAILLFVFKNSTLRSILLAILVSILIGILSGIITVLTRSDEDFLVHVPIFLFVFCMVLFFRPYSHYSAFRSVFIVMANCVFAAVPIYMYFYFTEYLDWFKIPYDQCEDNSALCDANREMLRVAGWICFWGGIVFYAFVGTILFKRKYETIWALPDRK